MVTRITEQEYRLLTGRPLSEFVSDEEGLAAQGIVLDSIEQVQGESMVVRLSHAAPLDLRLR